MSFAISPLYLDKCAILAFFQEMHLQRLFSAFPGGPPGIGLLLLRTAAGGTFLAQGLLSLTSHSHPAVSLIVAGLVLALTGAFMLIGFLTPIVSPFGAVQCVVILFGFPAQCGLLTSNLVLLRLIAVCLAIALIGPGAFSLDARLFGWKEIVIPPASHKSEH